MHVYFTECLNSFSHRPVDIIFVAGISGLNKSADTLVCGFNLIDDVLSVLYVSNLNVGTIDR